MVGSGGITHNLRAATAGDGAGSEVPWARAFADWVDGRLAEGDIDALLDWRSRAPDAARNHPTDEHLLPLFHALGAAGESWHARCLHRGAVWGSVMLDTWAFDS